MITYAITRNSDFASMDVYCVELHMVISCLEYDPNSFKAKSTSYFNVTCNFDIFGENTTQGTSIEHREYNIYKERERERE